MIDKVSLGRIIEEAQNDHDPTEMTNVINSMTHEQLVAIMALVPEHKGGVYSLTPQQLGKIAQTLQGNPDG